MNMNHNNRYLSFRLIYNDRKIYFNDGKTDKKKKQSVNY